MFSGNIKSGVEPSVNKNNEPPAPPVAARPIDLASMVKKGKGQHLLALSL